MCVPLFVGEAPGPFLWKSCARCVCVLSRLVSSLLDSSNGVQMFGADVLIFFFYPVSNNDMLGASWGFLMNTRMCTSISLFSCFVEGKCNPSGLSLLASSMSLRCS